MQKIDNELKLCYVEKIQPKPKVKDFSYRLYFTDNIDEVVGEDWGLPCCNVVLPPHDAYIVETYIVIVKWLTLDAKVIKNLELSTITRKPLKYFLMDC